MTIYEWNIVLITLYAFISFFIPYKKESKKIFIILSTVQLIFVQGLRSYVVGGDLNNYLTHFNTLDAGNFQTAFEGRFELGYNMFTYLVVNLGLSFENLLFIISLFNLSIFGYFVYKYSNQPYLSFILYIIVGMYDFGYSGLRQSIAMSIILIAYKYVNSREPIKFLVSVFLAFTFHYSALIFIVIYPLTNSDIKKYYLKFLPLIFLLVFLFSQRMGYFIIQLMDYNSDRFFQTTTTGPSYITMLVFFIFIIAIILFKYNEQIRIDIKFSNLLIIISMLLLIDILGGYSSLISRINLYLYHFSVIFIPLVLKNVINVLSQKNTIMKFTLHSFSSVTFFALSLIYYQIYLTNNPYYILPHYFFWEF